MPAWSAARDRDLVALARDARALQQAQALVLANEGARHRLGGDPDGARASREISAGRVARSRLVMKVAIFTDNDFDKVNGVTTTLRAVLQHAPSSVDLRVYTCDSVGIETPEYLGLLARGIGIPYYREMKVYVPPFRRFLRHAIADGVQLLHYTTPGPVGLAAMWVASRLNLPMVGSFHTDLAEYARVLSGSRWLGDVMQQYMKWPYGRCERIFVPSEATRELLVRSNVDRRKVEIWRRGVSTEQFNPARRSAALRAQWGASDSRPVLLYVGRLSREKGLDLLAPLSRALDDAAVSYRLVVVGDGPMHSDLRAACRGALFTGTLAPDDVAVAMASADLFVFPSRTDTAGNVVLEAQASGLPVLVTDEGGPRENMCAGETGTVCRDLAAFVQAAGEILQSAERRRCLGDAARRYAFTRRWDAALEPLYRSYGAWTAVAGRSPLNAPIAVCR
jgi:glycosyltransferase involved in cell wall biosynthesis